MTNSDGMKSTMRGAAENSSTGKRTMVTGASSGIGVETARVLASGAVVVGDTHAGDRTAGDTRTRTYARVQPAAELA